MAKQPYFDVLEDLSEMDSRPWKVKKNPIFSMPEASGKTKFLNNKTTSTTLRYDETLMQAPRKKTVRKDSRTERKKPEAKKIDIRKISLIRPDIPPLTPPPVLAKNPPEQESDLNSPSLINPTESSEQTASPVEAASETAPSAPDLEPASSENENQTPAPDNPTPPQTEPEEPEKQNESNESSTASPENPDLPPVPEDAVESEHETEQPGKEVSEPAPAAPDSETEQKTAEYSSDTQSTLEEAESEKAAEDPTAQSSQPETFAEYQPVVLDLDEQFYVTANGPGDDGEQDYASSSLKDVLSSSQQKELLGEIPDLEKTTSEPLYTGFASAGGARPVVDEKDLPEWARDVLKEKAANEAASVTSDGRRVWTFSTAQEEQVSNSPFASLVTDGLFEEEPDEPSDELQDENLDEWKEDYVEPAEEEPEEPEAPAEDASPSAEDDGVNDVAPGDQDAGAISYPHIPGDEEAVQQLREEEKRSQDEAKPEYQCSTYEIVSLIAYLIGVPKRIFENEYEPPKLEVYQRLDNNKPARIVRHLSICRTAIIRNYRQINENMRIHHMSLNNMPDLVPIESLRQLSADGVSFIRKTSTWPSHHIVEINKLINDRINNVKELFPLWLNWNYVKNIFMMPNGSKDKGTKAASDLYYANKYSYPYQIYINWLPGDEGNILFNDKKFVSLLYRQNHDSFLQMNKVSDAGSFVKESIYNYIEESEKLTVMVDCENSDPYRLCATFVNLDEEYLAKISRIILFDDLHASSAWKILEQFTSIPVEYILTKRVKEDKSLVDMKLATRACKEHYQNNVDSFIIVSSDSDYWGLIETLSDARFLVMVEREKCGADIKRALDENGIFYCFIDSFYAGNAAEIQNAALNMELNRLLHEQVNFNAKELFKKALHTARLNLSPAEKAQFYNRHIKQMTLKIDEDGSVSVELKR